MRKWLVLGAALIFLASAWAEAENAQKGGTLKVASPGMVLKIKLDMASKITGKKAEVPIPANKEAMLPAGKYDVAGIELYAQDEQKQVWGIESTTNLGTLKSIEVTQGQTTTVEGGQPLKLKVIATVGTGKAAPAPAAARKPGCASPLNAPAAKAPAAQAQNGGVPPLAAGQPKVVTVILRYVGKAGEEYAPRITKGNRPGTPPALRVMTYEGKVLDEGPYKFPASYTTGMG